MTVITVGVIGCGYWGPKLARNFHDLPGAELSSVADLYPNRLAHMRELYPTVHAFSDHRKVLDSEVDAVVVATPVSTHHRLVMEVLRAGKHLLVEKPLAATVEEATEIAETARQLGLIAMVGHTFQHNPAVKMVAQVIESGELGDIYYVDAARVNLGLLQPDINVVWDLAPHDVSILLEILNLDPVRVSARGEAYIRREPVEVAYLTLSFPGEVLASLRLSWLDPVKMRRITVVGSKKMLVYDDLVDEKVVIYDKGVDVPPYSDTPEEFKMSYRHGPAHPVPLVWEEPLRLECQSFVNSIQTGEPPSSDAWVGVKVVRVLEAADKSLRNGGLGVEIV